MLNPLFAPMFPLLSRWEGARAGRNLHHQEGHIDTGIVTIRNVKTGAAVLALVTRQLPSKTTGKLIFHQVGSQYALTEIWGGAGSPGMGLSVPKRNQELQVASGPSNAGDTFEIALK